MTEDQFCKETVLPASDPRSPYYINLPPYDAKPVDDLVAYFKMWKHFIKALVFYMKEISLSKEFDANLNYQLINSVQFPGFKDLPSRFLNALDSNTTSPPSKTLRKTNSNTSINTMATNTTTQSTPVTTPPHEKRPNLFKTKSNNSFLKSSSSNPPNQPSHKRNVSFNNLKTASTPQPPQRPHVSHQNDIKVPPNFFPEDSMFINLSPLLVNHHSHLYQSQLKLHRDLVNKHIPRLESTLKNLSLKIKEIRSSLKNDSFANSAILKEVSHTGKALSSYTSSVELYSSERPVLKKNFQESDEDIGATDDPFLLKLQVDYQIKKQLIQENYMFASYVNLQNISKELLVYVVKELNFALDRFAKLVSNESVYASSADSLVNLVLSIRKNITSDANKDWEYFVCNNKNFINIYCDTPASRKREIRSYDSLVLPYAQSTHNKCLRYGMMYKKQKIIKSYASYYYVLTCNYLHEFKVENEGNTKKREKDKIGGFIGHDDIPVKSYNLNDLAIREKDYRTYKFTLSKLSDPSKKYTLRCRNADEYHSWFSDLQELLKFGSDHLERFRSIERKTNESKIGTDKKSFSAVFTPSVKTPNGLVPTPQEQNPFDSTFISDMKPATPIASPNMSPRLSPHQVMVQDPQGSPVVATFSVPDEEARSPHQSQHEMYLEAQRRVLQQQRDAISSKLQKVNDNRNNDREGTRQKPSGLSLQPASPTETASLNSGSRASSSESLNSMVNYSNIKNMLQSNKNLINKDHSKSSSESSQHSEEAGRNDHHSADTGTPGSIELPTVYVSSDH
ncbi:Activator of SKN7 protein 10 [Meyerozyma sp. JA9]|nr:Activator of SKN7 protein 10 [Meyerozyma sp. JA9]